MSTIVVRTTSQTIVLRTAVTIVAGSGVPAGGATGQVLGKLSNTDGDADWIDQTGGSGVPDGGLTDQALLKDSNADGDAGWRTLSPTLVGAEPAGTAAGLVATEAAARASGDTNEATARALADSAHVAASDPHPQYLTAAEGNAAYDPLGAASTAIVSATAAEFIRDTIGAALTAGARITVTVDDPGDTITIAVAGLTTSDLSDFATAVDERARDALGQALAAGAGISVTVDDPGDTITIAVTTIPSTQISDFTEAVQDVVGAFVVAGTGITATYNDAANTLTVAVDTSAENERIDDRVAALLIAGANISLTYNDVANTLTVAVSGLTKSSVGLGNVDNTSDANKPVSTAQAAADALRITDPGGSNDDILQRKAGVWTHRTIVQLKTDLGATAATDIYTPAKRVVAPTTWANKADYSTDGTADEVQINQAITDVVAAGGGEVRLEGPNTYVQAAPVVMGDNVTLRLMPGAILKLVNGGNCHQITNADTTNGNTDMRVIGGTLDGNKANQTSSGKGIYWTANTAGPLYCTRPVVSGVRFHDTYDRAIHIIGIDGRVEDCYGKDCGHFQEQTFAWEHSLRCTFSRCTGEGGTDRDFEIAFSSYCQVSNCTSISPVSGAGLAIYSTSASNVGNVVNGFICISPQEEGIYLERCEKATIAHVRIFSPGTRGVWVTGTVANTIDCTFDDIAVYSPATDGFLIGGSGHRINNCHVYNALGGVSSTGEGIRTTAAATRISNCTIDTVKRNGILLDTGADNSSVVGCLVKNAGGAGTGGSTNGILVKVGGCQITGNRVFDDQGTATMGFGIRETSPADNNTIVANDVHGTLAAGGAAISVVGPSTVYANNQGF